MNMIYGAGVRISEGSAQPRDIRMRQILIQQRQSQLAYLHPQVPCLHVVPLALFKHAPFVPRASVRLIHHNSGVIQLAGTGNVPNFCLQPSPRGPQIGIGIP